MTLSFRLGKIPVSVQPSFFVTAVLFGAMGETDLRMGLAWIAILFVSILVHELGHATMAMSFGLVPRIDLHGMGGTTSYNPGPTITPARRIAISLAGPAAGLVLGAFVVFGLGPHAFGPSDIGRESYKSLCYINIGWGLLNLVPMLPLDGGNVMAQILNVFTNGRGERPARIVSIVVAVLAVPLAFFVLGNWWAALLSASFVATNARGLRDYNARMEDEPFRAAIVQAHAALDARDAQRLLDSARPVALKARSAGVRAEALQLVAYGFLLEGRVADADAALAAMPRGYAPHPSLVELRARTAG